MWSKLTRQEVLETTRGHTDLAEVHMAEDSGAYYLILVTLVRVIWDDQA